MIDYVTRDFTGDLVDDYTGYPMHRGLGPFSRGQTGHRSLGAIGHPRTFGHSGVGTSTAGPSGRRRVGRLPEQLPPRQRMAQQAHLDILSTLAHASILE